MAGLCTLYPACSWFRARKYASTLRKARVKESVTDVHVTRSQATCKSSDANNHQYIIIIINHHHQYIIQDSVCVSVCNGCDSLPQRVLWERGYIVYRNAYAGNESPKMWSGRRWSAIATVTGRLRRRDSRHWTKRRLYYRRAGLYRKLPR